MQTFSTGYLCWFITNKLYDSVPQNALIKLSDRYAVDYNVNKIYCLNYLLKFHASTSKHQKSKT